MFSNVSLGYYTSSDRSKYVITKIDLYGNIIFAKAYGDSGYEHTSESINKISDGNYILSDSKGNYSTNGVTAGLIKITPQGDTLWTRYFSSGKYFTAGRCAIETRDKGFALVGWTKDSVTNSQWYLVKTDSIGNKLWEKQYGGSLQEDTRSIVETPDKGFLIAGWTTSYGSGSMDGFLIKTDSMGTKLWQKTYGGTSLAESFSTITSLIDGNYLLTGEKCLGPGIYDNDQGYLVKIDPNGNILWQKNYGSPNNDAFFASKELYDSSIIVAASVYDTINNSWDCWILKLNSTGDALWSRIYASNFDTPNSVDYFFDVVPTQDRGFAFGGFCHGSTHTQDAWLLKADSLGCEIANCSVGIKELEITNELINIYPNPCQSQISIEFDLPETKNVLIEIKNILGQTLKTINNSAFKKGSNKIEIDVLSFREGLYFVQLQTENKVVCKKFVKE